MFIKDASLVLIYLSDFEKIEAHGWLYNEMRNEFGDNLRYDHWMQGYEIDADWRFICWYGLIYSKTKEDMLMLKLRYL